MPFQMVGRLPHGWRAGEKTLMKPRGDENWLILECYCVNGTSTYRVELRNGHGCMGQYRRNRKLLMSDTGRNGFLMIQGLVGRGYI